MTSVAAEFASQYGPWALVAGGSEGIGAAFAADLAARGCDVVLVAHHPDALEETATRLRMTGREVRTITADLSDQEDRARVISEVAGLDLGLVVWVAAAPAIGRFTDVAVEDLGTVVDLNVRGPVEVVRSLVPGLVARGRGGIILMGSLSAVHGAEMVATYAATKAFTTVWAEGLWSELRPLGVDVVAVTPGATDTPGMRRSNPSSLKGLADAAEVARAGLDGLGHGPVVVPGAANRFAATLLGRLLPRRAAIRVVSTATRRLYDKN